MFKTPSTTRTRCSPQPGDSGPRVLRDLEDTDYGSRGFSISDAEGNRWSFGTYAGQVS